jgi:hypothetical protein
MAAGGDGIAHAFDPEDVGQLMRVPEDRRALGEDNFRVALGGGGNFRDGHGYPSAPVTVGAIQRMALVGIGAAAARVHAGDHFAGDADIGFADFAGDHVDYLRPGQEQVKRYFTPGGHDGARRFSALLDITTPAQG